MAIATKPKPRQTTAHRKRHGKHQRRDKAFMKPYWPYLTLLAIIGVAMLFNNLWLKQGVLDYATNTTINGLHAGTNMQRVQNGLGQLALNATLSQAAQAKANDMVARDYWAHNTPDGQEPWVFITNTGYKYLAAGENLAYGFATSDQTIGGWMNSPGHRANILNGNFTEVGFGIANSENYQHMGHQTIVVAMYARPVEQTVQVSAQVGQPSAPPKQQTVQAQPQQPEPVVPDPATEQPEPASEETAPKPEPVASTESGVQSDSAQKQVSRLQLVANVSPWGVALGAIVAVLLGLILVARHSVAWHRALVKGEKFIVRHKALDIVIVSAIMLAIIFSQTVGFIQ